MRARLGFHQLGQLSEHFVVLRDLLVVAAIGPMERVEMFEG